MTETYRGLMSENRKNVTVDSAPARLMRQRTRWFQGNLQALHLLRSVAREQRGLGRADTLWQILTPYLLLTGSLLTLSFLITMVTAGVAAVLRWEQSWMWLVGAYVIAFGPALIYAWIYWRIERREGLNLLKAVGYAHLFVLYGLLPSLYGWRAVARELTGRTGSLSRHQPAQHLRAQDGLRRRGDDKNVRHRALHELGARALEDEAPAREDAECGGHAVDLVEQVAGDHDGDALAGELDQQPAHLLDTGRVQAVGGLIEDEQLGLAGQRQSDAEALLHTQ